MTAAIEPPFDLLVVILAWTGIRFGEVVALRRSACNTRFKRLVISESLAEVNGQLYFGSTKSHQTRKVVIPDFLCPLLEEHLAGRVQPEPSAPVFTSPDRLPVRYSNFRTRRWLPAIKKAALGPLKVHELRHTYASLAAKSGASVKMVQQQLGHKDPALPLRLYQHLFEDDLDALGNRMSAAFEESLRNSRPDRGLTIVTGESTASPGSLTRTSSAPPAGFEPATHGLGICGLTRDQAHSHQRLRRLTCDYSYTILCHWVPSASPVCRISGYKLGTDGQKIWPSAECRERSTVEASMQLAMGLRKLPGPVANAARVHDPRSRLSEPTTAWPTRTDWHLTCGRTGPLC